MESRSRFSKAILIITAALSVALVGASIAFYILFIKAPTDLANSTAQGIKEFFNFTPQVKINQTVVIEQNTPIMEVATVSRQVYVDYTWSHKWLGSTKTIELHASFTAKAGFDLSEPFTIDIQRYPLQVEAKMPPPKILSLEMNTYKIVRDENGWWNRISDEDRENVMHQVQAIAREKAENSGILKDALSTVEARIREIVQHNGATVEFKYPWQD